MKLLECEAKEVFREFGISTPEGGVASSAEEAEKVAARIGGPVAVKAQLPVGGRGKAGGILFAETPAEAAEVAGRLLGSRLKGVEVRKVLVEEKLGIEDEVYIGVVVDRRSRSHVVLASSEGGVDIEEVAATAPEKIVRFAVDPLQGLRPYHARWVAKQVGFSGRRMMELAGLLLKLYRVAVEMDAELTEINPLALTAEGFVAADARLNVDNNALFRHPDLEERFRESELAELTEREQEARSLGLTYVELDGNIGIIGNGAGLTMATLDTVTLHGGRPGDFLDLGGGAPPDRIEAAVAFVLSDPRIDALFVNILGGITRCDDTARGLIEARRRTGSEKPIVVRMMGTNEEEGRRLLREAGIDTLDTMEEAAERVVALAGRR
ncbi:ADP-forming succinate--CoA ligase subunit beta [Candidatus Bathyarchaeota archaeon]|nr:MAG: ADP-forming succinate--CoA ligase subunit beta [Candidatus Bathyarchaeota archaeon]